MMINLFKLTIEPEYYHRPGSMVIRRARITVEIDRGERIQKEHYINLDSFESEFEWFMRRAVEELKDYVKKLKEEEKIRKMSAKEMEEYIKDKLSGP